MASLMHTAREMAAAGREWGENMSRRIVRCHGRRWKMLSEGCRDMWTAAARTRAKEKVSPIVVVVVVVAVVVVVVVFVVVVVVVVVVGFPVGAVVVVVVVVASSK